MGENRANPYSSQRRVSPRLPKRTGAPVPWSALSRALVDEEIERLAASREFCRSPRHLRLLRHLVRCTIEGDHARLREMVLGVEVFHRSPARFDPRTDTIVRVEVRRLRQKLVRYYAEEGIAARLQFELPLRSYAVEAHWRLGAAESSTKRASVAVLPLAGTSDDRVFVDGCTSAIAKALARLNGLRVVAGSSLEGASGRNPIELGRAVDVASVLHGSMRTTPDGFSVSLELVRTLDGAPMWSRSTTAARAAAPAALESLARAIIAVLHRDAEEQRLQRISLAGRRPYVRIEGNAEARDLIYRGQWCLRDQAIDSHLKAVDLFEAAIALTDAPNAHAGLALALVHLVGLTSLPSKPAMESARRAALRAVEINPQHGGAWGTLGTIHHSFDRDWPAAEAALLKAVRFAPADAGAHSRYGWSLMFNLRFAEARAELSEARALAPLDLTLRTHEALVSLYERDYGRADAALADVLHLAPNHLIAANLRAALHLYAGRPEAARAAYAALLDAHPRLTIGRCGLAQACALLGDLQSAQAGLAWLQAMFEDGFASPYQLAMVCARMDRPDEALEWLAQAAELRDFNFVCVPVDPAFDRLRGDPRWSTLLARNGFGHLLPPQPSAASA
ncbi:MAG TPA: hypothetical protein VGV08_02145 [Casimicrobiaceae bacterium]|nr:hypothetical protein [Casimicrobiaceae bacterium]